MTDWELIQRFAETRDEAAFEKIVERYGGLVFASARRQVGPDAAGDVTQAVFLVLAKKAHALRSDVILSSWLFRTTGFAVAQIRRQEARRARREAWAAMNSPDSTHPEIQDDSVQFWQRHLDDAVAALPEVDRQYILVRFFERRKFAELADRFGVSEDAAKKRVARAVDRLRSLLSARGVALSSAALATRLSENRVEAIPASFVATIVRLSKQAATLGSSSAGLVELTNAASGGWRRESFRPWLVPSPPMAVALISLVVVIWAGQGWFREWLGSHREPQDSTSARGTPVVVAAMRERAEAARQRAPGVSQIELTVVDAMSGSPIPDARVVERRRGSSEGAPFDERVHVADAQGICRVQVEDRRFEKLELIVSALGRTPAELSWASYEFNREILSYRCALHPGTTIVGEVRDAEHHGPIAGASIGFRTSAPYDLGGRERFDVQMETTTDSAGRFVFEGVPAAEAKIREGITVPTVEQCVATIEATHTNFVGSKRTLSVSEAKSGLVIIELDRGGILRGLVTDVGGQPLTGAQVKERGKRMARVGNAVSTFQTDHWGPDFGRETLTDSDGHFELRHVMLPRLGEALLSFVVAADGFAAYDGLLIPEHEVSQMSDEIPQPERSIAPWARHLIGTNFFDNDGAEWRGDSDGRAHPTGRHKWVRKPSGDPSAPVAIEVRVRMVRLMSGETGDVTVLSGAENADETNSPVKMLVSGRVTDSDTGEPIPAFQVHSRGDALGGAGLLLGDGVKGAFAWDLGSRWKDSAILEVRASGYLPASPDHREESPGERRFEFRLRSASEIWGWVELPNTRPAVGALITTVDTGTPSRWNMAGDPNLEEPDSSSVRAGRDGRFRLRPNPGAKLVRILHPDGYAIRPIAAGNDTVLRLEPWASVEGQLTESDQPVAGATIRLVPGPVEPGWGIQSRLPFTFEVLTRTDGAGRFRFERVPGGDLQVISENASVSVQVRSGRSVSVALRR